MHLDRKAKDTDYLLITEDMKTYGCGCCSIGLGVYTYCKTLFIHVTCNVFIYVISNLSFRTHVQ